MIRRRFVLLRSRLAELGRPEVGKFVSPGVCCFFHNTISPTRSMSNTDGNRVLSAHEGPFVDSRTTSTIIPPGWF